MSVEGALGGQGGEGAGACAYAKQGAARGHANLGTACLLTLSGGVEDSRARLASASLWLWENEYQTGHDNQPHSQHDDETDLVSPLLRLEHIGYQTIHVSHVVYCAGPRAGQLDRTAVAGRSRSGQSVRAVARELGMQGSNCEAVARGRRTRTVSQCWQDLPVWSVRSFKSSRMSSCESKIRSMTTVMIPCSSTTAGAEVTRGGPPRRRHSRSTGTRGQHIFPGRTTGRTPGTTPGRSQDAPAL
jgi:hypothetical protein